MYHAAQAMSPWLPMHGQNAARHACRRKWPLTDAKHSWAVSAAAPIITTNAKLLYMKLVTWNVNSLKVRLPQVLQWLADNPVDVLCLQETKLTDDKFPAAEIEAAGYHVVFSGQKTYNGVAILSKSPISDVVRNNPLFEDAQQRILAATIDGVRIVCVYVPNGQSIDSDKYEYKLAWLGALHAWIAGEVKAYPQLAILGQPPRNHHGVGSSPQ